MFKKWTAVLLYVILNAPIQTSRNLWKPAGSPSVTATKNASSSASLTAVETSTPGVRQHLKSVFDLSESHLFGFSWIGLNKPASQTVPTPSITKTEPAAPISPYGQKEHLSPAPKHVMADDKNLHPYYFHFEGKTTLGDQPLADAMVSLKVSTPRRSFTRKVSSDAQGHYTIDLPLNGADNENVLWWLEAETHNANSPEAEGSQIFAVASPSVTVQRDLVLIEANKASNL